MFLKHIMPHPLNQTGRDHQPPDPPEPVVPVVSPVNMGTKKEATVLSSSAVSLFVCGVSVVCGCGCGAELYT